MAVATYSVNQVAPSGTIQTIGFLNNIRIDDTPDLDGKYTIISHDRGDGVDITQTLSFLGYTASGAAVFGSASNPQIFTNTPYAFGAPMPSYTPATTFVACFLAGTLISTPQGTASVETLAVDDLVSTVEGGVARVKWIGRQTVATMFGGSAERAPICISAGALGDNSPARDLKLTADHALLIDGVLVQAGALVNGVTIRRMTPAETGAVYTVWHIETEGHQIIRAEGVPAETFVDNISRRRFDNYAEYEALFGDDPETILEMDLPRAMSARQLPASVRDLIAVRRAA